MNLVWSGVMVFGLGLLILGNADLAVSSMLDGGAKAITLGLKLWGIYAVWLGLLRIVEETELDKKLSRLLRPLIRLLIGKCDKYTENQVAINITSNMLGMGNASTPSGINAIAGLDKGSKYATTGMIMILILNATGLQLIPTTIIGLRALAGSTSSTDIIVPTFLATLLNTLVGIVLVKICGKIFKDRE